MEALGQTGPSILILKNIELISGKEFKVVSAYFFLLISRND